jgi:hypothetical protein
MRSVVAAAAVVLSGALLPQSLTSHASARCSLTPGFFPNQGVLMLATPHSDTVRAGPGDLRLGEGPGHTGNGQRLNIYGQRFRVHRIGGESAIGIEETKEAVLVPWDYDAGCSPVPWARSAHWLQGSDTVLLSVRRRGPAHWAGGVPTFDVSPVPQSVYAGKWWEGQAFYDRSEIDSLTPVNTPSGAFEFLIRRPAPDALLSGDERTLLDLEQWAFEHPEIVARNPAARWLTDLRSRVRTAKLMTQSVPFLGTWRVTLRTRSGQQITRYFRTMDKPFVPWNEGTAGPATASSGPDGFELQFNWASTERELPTEHQAAAAHWGMSVASRSPATERHWKFAILPEEFGFLADSFPEVQQITSQYYKRVLADGDYTEERALNGDLTLLAGERAVFRIGWDADGDGKHDLVATGERVSRVTAPEPSSWPKFQRW